MQGILLNGYNSCKAKNALAEIALTLFYIVFPPCWLLAFFGCGLYGKIFKNRVTSFFNRYIVPPIAVIGLFFFVFAKNGIYPFGNKTIAWCDLTQQGVPYWMNFKSVLEGKDDLFLSMSNAAGMNGITLIRSFFFYPFSYIALLLERAEMMEAVTVMLVLKFATCSITAMVFFKIACKKLHPSLAAALSLMYSFCAYGLMYYQIINWPDTMYVTPLFFAGVYLLVKEGKIALYAISLAFVMQNFAFCFMTVLATILFFGYYCIANKSKTENGKPESNKVALNFAIGSAFAALLCTFKWIAFFSSFGASARGVNLEETLAAETFFTSKNTLYPLLMSSAFIFVSAFSFKRYAKNAVEKSCMFVFGMMMIPVLMEPINAMWHGGSYMSFPGRYVYLIIFLGLAISGALLSHSKTADEELSDAEVTGDNRSKWVNLAVNICSCYIFFIISKYLLSKILVFLELKIAELDNYSTTLWGNSSSYKNLLVIFVAFIFLYAVAYAFYRWKLITKQVLALILVITFGFEAYCALNIYVVPPTTKVNTESFRLYADLEDKIEDEDFYRVKNEKFLRATYSVSEANFPGAIGYKSMGHYSSLASETYLYFAKALGYSSMWMKIESFGGTKFSDALMSVKYTINTLNEKKDAVYRNEKYQIEENEYYLPLGVFSYEQDIDVDLMKISRIDLQEMIYDSLTNNKYDLFEEMTPVASNCTFKSSAKSSDKKYHIAPKSGASATLEYKIQIDGTKTLYFDCFDEFSNELSEKIYNAFSIHVNGKKVKSKYPVDSSNGILNLGTFTDTTVTVKLGVLEKVACRSFGVFTMDDDLLTKTISEVNAATLTLDGNEFYGTYNAKEDGAVVVSVPYGGGFKCTVNGKEIELEQAYGGLISIPVSKGENSINLSYVPPLFYEGIIISVIGILIGIAAYIFMRKKKYATVYDGVYDIFGEKAVDVLGVIAKVCTIIALIAVIFALYVYPMLLKLSNYTELPVK